MDRLEKYLQLHPNDQKKKDVIAFLAALDHIEESQPDVAKSIEKELIEQRSHLKMIASENFCSLAVQLAMGNLLTDKYAEGYPHHRFYAGCENVDTLEELATTRLKKLFNAESAYVQPHSGADANLVAFWSILVQRVQNREVEKLSKKKIADLTEEEYETVRRIMMNQTLMGMSLDSGGHLTHGYLHNLSSKMFRAVTYDVERENEMLDYQKLSEKVKEVKPTILLAGYSAYPRRLNFAKMREIADTVGAVLLVDMAHFAGLVAGRAFKGDYDPVPFADIVTSTTHKTLRGPRGGFILCKKEFEEVINKGCPLVLGGPLPHVIAAKAIAFAEADKPEFQQYAEQVIANAKALATRLKERNLRLVTGGTENHIVIIDVSNLNLTGRHAETILRKAGITANRNAIPYDKNGPWYTSGVRLGTAALTTRGFLEEQMVEIANIIADILKTTTPLEIKATGKKSLAKCKADSSVLARGQAEGKKLLDRFPLYPEIVL